MTWNQFIFHIIKCRPFLSTAKTRLLLRPANESLLWVTPMSHFLSHFFLPIYTLVAAVTYANLCYSYANCATILRPLRKYWIGYDSSIILVNNSVIRSGVKQKQKKRRQKHLQESFVFFFYNFSQESILCWAGHNRGD